jgi:hypothetical protein
MEKERKSIENCCTPIGQITRYVDCKGCDKKPNQETLEEAAEKYAKRSSSAVFQELHAEDFIAGAKWQAERMYSEEDLREAFKQSRQCKIFEKDMPPIHNEFEDWFEQFKNK